MAISIPPRLAFEGCDCIHCCPENYWRCDWCGYIDDTFNRGAWHSCTDFHYSLLNERKHCRYESARVAIVTIGDAREEVKRLEKIIRDTPVKWK